MMVPDQNRQGKSTFKLSFHGGNALLIADRRAIHRISVSGAYQSRLATVDAVRTLWGRRGQVAAIDGNAGAPAHLARRHAAHVPAQGPGINSAASRCRFRSARSPYVLERNAMSSLPPPESCYRYFPPPTRLGNSCRRCARRRCLGTTLCIRCRYRAAADFTDYDGHPNQIASTSQLLGGLIVALTIGSHTLVGSMPSVDPEQRMAEADRLATDGQWRMRLTF